MNDGVCSTRQSNDSPFLMHVATLIKNNNNSFVSSECCSCFLNVCVVIVVYHSYRGGLVEKDTW